MALKGLIIRQPWIGLILSGQKTWEMRSQGTSVRGTIALIEQGTGTVVGLAELGGSLPPLKPGEMPLHFERHRIPQGQVEQPGFNWLTPWVITNARRLDRPVPYRHKSGAVIWVDLDPEVEAAVTGKSRSGAAPSSASSSVGTGVTAEHAAMARLALDDSARGPAKLRIPADASTSISRKGNKLYVDVQWDDGRPTLRRGGSSWAELIGMIAALISMICLMGFTIHLPLGVFSSSISAFSAFKWLIPMLISGLVATVLGQGHLLQEFGKS